MFLLLIAAAVALAPPASVPSAAPPSAHPQATADMPVVNPDRNSALCPETPMSLARKMGERATRAMPLGELPPAHMFLAVDRRVDGCAAPLIVRSGVGGR